jgi:CMP-N,N'-diacetyllegionaminic acid synthase
MYMEVLAVIPARGGSERIPRKNLVELLGKPLIYYTIKAAKDSKRVTRVIVSTDDDEILEVSKKFGAEVIMRPERLCRNAVSSAAAMTHAIECLRESEYEPEIVTLLQPTSPLRDGKDIDSAVDMLLSHPDAKSLFSVCRFEHPPFWAVEMDDGYIRPVFGREKLINTELLPRLYRPNGAIGMARTEEFLKGETFYTDRTLGFLMPREKGMDVDEKLDLKIVKALMGALR